MAFSKEVRWGIKSTPFYNLQYHEKGINLMKKPFDIIFG